MSTRENIRLIARAPFIAIRQFLHVNFCMLCNFSCFCCFLLNFFNINFFKQKKYSGTLSEFQTVRIQIKTDVLSVLIWVQTVCKGYQQTTKVHLAKKDHD